MNNKKLDNELDKQINEIYSIISDKSFLNLRSFEKINLLDKLITLIELEKNSYNNIENTSGGLVKKNNYVLMSENMTIPNHSIQFTDKVMFEDKTIKNDESIKEKWNNTKYEENKMTTNGSVTKLGKDTIQCCGCCKYYNPNMIVRTNEECIICKHCFFWLNYDVNLREEIDGNYGCTITQYILDCYKDHNTSLCVRAQPHNATDGRGCFLCDYNLGKSIEHVKDAELLEKKILVKDDKIKPVISIKEDNFPKTIHI